MTENPLVKKIHISLDSIIDTRLGTLIKLSPEFAYQVSTHPTYYTRQEDLFQTEAFGQLSKARFQQLFQTYRDDIIRGAVMTKIFVFLRELCTVLVNQAVATPYFGEVELEVNLHPFQFTEPEIDALIKAISHHLGHLFSVSVVSLSPAQLTPDYVQQNHVALILYDPKPWLDTHHRTLQKGHLKDLVLYTPALNHIRALTEEEQATLKERNMDVFQVFTLVMAPFISMQFLPVALFSADTLENKSEYYS